MPLLQREGTKSAIALTKDKERVLAYSLTAAALRRLKDSGVRVGSVFPTTILVSLIRTGDAHSPRPAESAGQGKLFGEEITADELPRCEVTGTMADLHLVVHAVDGAAVAQILSADARFVLRKATSLSIPIWTLNSRLIDQLEMSAAMPRSSNASALLRLWFLRDYQDAWSKLARANAVQSALNLGPSEEELSLHE
jgi:hypothetical protein